MPSRSIKGGGVSMSRGSPCSIPKHEGDLSFRGESLTLNRVGAQDARAGAHGNCLLGYAHMSTEHKMDVEVEVIDDRVYHVGDHHETDLNISNWILGYLQSHLVVTDHAGEVVRLKIGTFLGAVKISGTTTTEAIRLRIEQMAGPIKKHVSVMKSFDTSGVKATKADSGEPAPPRTPRTDAQMARDLEHYIGIRIAPTTLGNETFDVSAECVGGKATLLVTTNSTMLRLRVEELLPRARAEIVEIKSITVKTLAPS